MNIDFSKLDTILTLLHSIEKVLTTQTEKRWLTTRELSDYIGYSLDSINKMVKDDVFIDGVHYYKPSKKLLFDKIEVDNWIVGLKSKKARHDVNSVVNRLLTEIK